MKKIIILLVVAVLLAGGVFFSMPLMTLQRIKSAITAKDSQRLAKEVDMPVLRANLKEQLRGPAGQLVRRVSGNEFEAFIGSMFSSYAVDELADEMVTPEGLLKLMQGKPKVGKSENASSEKDTSTKTFHWKNLSTFELIVTPKEGKPVTLVLSRRSLSWKLTNIILPIS